MGDPPPPAAPAWFAPAIAAALAAPMARIASSLARIANLSANCIDDELETLPHPVTGELPPANLNFPRTILDVEQLSAVEVLNLLQFYNQNAGAVSQRRKRFKRLIGVRR